MINLEVIMKRINILLTALILVLAVNFASAENLKEVKIKTSAQCEMCKETIEKAVNKLDGIKSVNLNLKTFEAEVKYDEDEVKLEKIKKAISNAGYDADDVTADKKAYRKLPKCCKKGGHR